MERSDGYVRVDSPAGGSLSVQIRWMDAGRKREKYPSLATSLLPWLSGLFGKSKQSGEPDLKQTLENLLQQTAKQAKKARARFESTSKPSRVEDGREAISFSWLGAGRGQGKIWHCPVCNRVVIAQAIGLVKDQAQIGRIASQLFASLRCHAEDGMELWALYDHRVEVPKSFQIESQKLLSGYLMLVFRRGGERLTIERWGLANVVLKKFSMAEWLRTNARARVPISKCSDWRSGLGHDGARAELCLGFWQRLAGIRSSPLRAANRPSRYGAVAWACPDTNKIHVLQMSYHPCHESEWECMLGGARCHAGEASQLMEASA